MDNINLTMMAMHELNMMTTHLYNFETFLGGGGEGRERLRLGRAALGVQELRQGTPLIKNRTGPTYNWNEA